MKNINYQCGIEFQTSTNYKNNQIMDLNIQIKMNDKLFLRDPEQTDLGRKIISQGILLMQSLGFEEFTFKKLATHINTTEASIYRYFENKHRLLAYFIAWHWSWQEYQVIFHTKNLHTPEEKLKTVIELLSVGIEDGINVSLLDKYALQEIVVRESPKVYLTKHVYDDNKNQLFKPYKDLVKRIADLMLEINPTYPYARSLSSTIIEMSHQQRFFMNNLPRLTDFGNQPNEVEVEKFLEHLVFSCLLPPQ